MQVGGNAQFHSTQVALEWEHFSYQMVLGRECRSWLKLEVHLCVVPGISKMMATSHSF